VAWDVDFYDGGEVLNVVRESRSKRVLSGILGEGFIGVIVCDGLKVLQEQYGSYSVLGSSSQGCEVSCGVECRGLASIGGVVYVLPVF